MLKPISIKVMNIILYILVAIDLIIIPSVINYANKDGATPPYGILFAGFAALLLMIYFVRKKRLVPSLLLSFVVLISSIIGQIQLMLSLILMMLFFLKSTRDYFKSAGAVSTAESEAEEVTTSEADGNDVGEEAAVQSDETAESQPKPQLKLRKDPEIHIREATPEDADTVYSLMMIAFEEYRTAIPPSSALQETEEAIEEALRSQSESAAILFEDDTATAMVRFKIEGDVIYFFRLSVVPNRRRRGHARKLVQWIERHAISKGLNVSRCKVRQSVQNNLVLYQNMGYEIVDQELVLRPEGTVKTLKLEKQLGV
ncbi:GNAT family N-acetyltransferase [Cohnella endophytica]|uniref:GNAT family N-acetyltransferase n=1 Tax=Cohnella endophytica TaxID=2419778 RepID=A0A494Y1X6_9BACL|nr:GNAT family N-acetyltransferase [Cohnella endophytica]RKP53866.1 GNAT family N-acetyltransferase [Cohnella endophytica]